MKTNLFLYDTKTRQLENIIASNSRSVRVYCCGPTVYRDAHVGNMRTFLLSDLVARILDARGIKVHIVQNVTDVGHMSEDFAGNESLNSVEDKMLLEAMKERTDPFLIAREFENKFHEDLALLNITPASLYPRASDSIDLMQDLIARLIALGNAYVGADGAVYFSAESFPRYGDLSGNRLDALQPGHRYEYQGNGAKRFHADWALWKAAAGRTEMIWPSPWGEGFPGWHIECSAMSIKFLDGHVDLHLGGIDLRFPHHENERAQSNSSIGNEEVVDRWVHGEHLLFEGRKMSKSAGNVVLVRDLQNRGIDPLALRLCFLENRYRNQMDLTWNSLGAADSTLTRWRRKISEWRTDPQVDSSLQERESEAFLSDCENDLDFPKALQRLRNLEKENEISVGTKAAIFLFADRMLGLDLDKGFNKEAAISLEIQALLSQRAKARINKDFDVSDALRNELLQNGISVMDTPQGQNWEFIG